MSIHWGVHLSVKAAIHPQGCLPGFLDVLSAGMSVCPSEYQSVGLFVCPSRCPAIHLVTCLSIGVSICPSVCLFLGVSINQLGHPPVRRGICPSGCPSVHLGSHLSIWVAVFLSVWVSICQAVHFAIGAPPWAIFNLSDCFTLNLG